MSPRKEVALPVPDDLHTPPVGGPGRIHQHPARSNADRRPSTWDTTKTMGSPPRSRRANASGWIWHTTTTDVIQNALICFNDTPPTGVILPFVANAASCAANDPANPLLANSYYTNHTNFGMAAVRFKPAKRVTANLGYSITSVDGSIPQFNILQPLGSLQYKYQQPVANLSVDFGQSWLATWAGIITSTARVRLSVRQRHAIFTPTR